MVISLKSRAINQIIPMFSAKLNRPRVSILMGVVRNLRIGFIKTLISPRTEPASSSVFQVSNPTLSINLCASQNPKIPEAI